MSLPPPIAWRASPNVNDRRGGAIDILLLHYTGMEGEEAALDRLCDPESRVSSHYVVFSDGRVVQMVDEARRAWHAGAAKWCGESDINSRSIGIEIANIGHAAPGGAPPPFAEPQIEALIALCKAILGRHAIPPHRVLAHSDVAPTRKADPGERFPWERLAEAGIGHWVAPEPLSEGPCLRPGDRGPEVEAVQGLLALYGYGVPVNGGYDGVTAAIVTAFQRHFRPELVDGAADGSTVRTLLRLIAALP